MKKTLAKLKTTITSHPLETITAVSVATAVGVVAYYTKTTHLKVDAAGLRMMDRHGGGLVYEFNKKAYILIEYNRNR